ncbi:MAG: LPS-assembly protein LptD [Methylococcales symbiont of Iophon sp. n. MRB-2018]|nr:MAG: LPS-assembly protein LptD [Methylococcales symbiont of Iophon sp. n. MRB-2018]KAF3979177.1 MAG: LPS-assembly protein LptD [Methylococcales symbiont of Iophon sp. n. MRB-2018]
MHCKLLIVIFLFIYSGLGFADSGAWNCEKIKDQEWSCSVEESKATEIQSEDALPVQPESSPVKILAPPEPVKTKPKQQGVYVTPPDTIAKRSGWTCKANGENGTQSCGLAGVDPKVKARGVDDLGAYDGFFASAFDYNQEQVFETLQAQLKYDPWKSCLASSKDKSQYIPGKDLRDTAPIDINADYSEVFDKEITSFFGNVEIIRADQKVLSDMASYDTVSETIDAQGHVYYSEDELSLYSDTALLNLGTDEARLRKAMFIAPSAPLRGSADVVYQDSKLLSRYTNAAFTSCRPGNQDWVVHAERLKMNKEAGEASAKNAWLEFKGVPVLYTPYIYFPLDDRRITGLLTPSFGNDEDNGFDATIPYYWNIAPNYDLTVWARYMSKRGAMFGGDFRYLTKKNEGSLGLEYLPYDLIEDKPRYSGYFQDKARYTEKISSDIDLNYVSDSDYFDNLNDALGIATDRFLKSQATFNYNQQGIAFRTHLEGYQTIDQNVIDNSKPYLKLPQVSLNLNHSFDKWPIDLAMDNEYVHFYRDGAVQGQRFNLKPSIELPLETTSGFIKPKISLQYTQYILENQIEGKADDIARVLPIVSVDGGLTFEKDVNFASSKYLHTIEPRLFYLYIPKNNQDDTPIFDTALNDFNFSSLFRENRFSGTDRVQNANQISMALTTQLIDAETGQDRLTLSLGNIFYFTDRVVTLRENDAVETNNFSNVVTELSGQLTDHFSFFSGLQWSPDNNDIERGQIEFRYRNQPEQIINVGYRYRRDHLNENRAINLADASIRWPLYDEWFGVGRWQYSIEDNLTTESFLGLEKESCCWRFRILWRRHTEDNNSASEHETSHGVFVQLELKGLASFGDTVDDFLEKNLKGYLRPK